MNELNFYIELSSVPQYATSLLQFKSYEIV